MATRASFVVGAIVIGALAPLAAVAQSLSGHAGGGLSQDSRPPESIERGMPTIGIQSELDSDKGARPKTEMGAGTFGTSQSSGRSDFKSSLSGPSVGAPSPGSTGVGAGPIGGDAK